MKIAICDDDVFYAKQLKQTVGNCVRCGTISGITLYNCAEDLLDAYEKQGLRYDILFLDIKLKKLSGLDAAKVINNLDNNVLIFLVTAYADYVFEGYEVRAFRYIVKPFTPEQIGKDMRMALKHLYSFDRKYTIQTKSSIMTFNVDDILFLESIKRQVSIVSTKGRTSFYSKLSTEEEKLSQYGFVRVHQGYLVNMAQIKTIIENNIYLTDNTIIPISKSQKKALLTRYTKYLTEYEGI